MPLPNPPYVVIQSAFQNPAPPALPPAPNFPGTTKAATLCYGHHSRQLVYSAESQPYSGRAVRDVYRSAEHYDG